jgi:hypothetical protein
MGPDQDLINEVIATFPKTFGLSGFPGSVALLEDGEITVEYDP